MPTPAEIHQAMADGYKAQMNDSFDNHPRYKNHFQVRLDDELAMKLRHYMQDRSLNANQALKIIVSKFFR